MSYPFFKRDDFNFSAQIVLGGAPYHCAEPGECLAAVEQIKDDDIDSWYDNWMALADRVRGIGESALAKGHTVSAREAFLRASNYYGTAFFYVLGTRDPSRSPATWQANRDTFDRAVKLWDTPVTPVEIPYENTKLKGYFFAVDNSGARRPLLIMNNGSDGTVVEMLVMGGIDGLARGYNVLIFDGPGQGEALYVQKIPFRYDWEKVITPVVDWATVRSDVDAKKIALLGVSQAGYWVPRAVAFEHRIAAAIADPGVVQVWTSWWNAWVNNLPPVMLQLLASGDKQTFDQYMGEGLKQQPPESLFQFTKRAEPYGTTSYFDLLTELKKYDLTGVADKITCPTAIADPDNEQFWSGQPQQLYNMLTCPKTLIRFTTAEGADGHCEPLAQQLRSQRIFDWLDETLH